MFSHSLRRRVTLVALTIALVGGACGSDQLAVQSGSEGATSTTTESSPTSTTVPPTAPTTATTTPATTPTTAATTSTTAPPATTTTTRPRRSNTQFFVSTGGCKNEINYIRMGLDRRVAQSKTVLKAASNLQLIPLAERDDQLLFSTFDCGTDAHALYEIGLAVPNATPRLIASNLSVVDADYDIKSKAVLVLASHGGAADYTVVSIDPASLAQTERWRRPEAWASQSLYPDRLRALTGGEMMISASSSGTGRDGKFIAASVTESGTTRGGVTGDGRVSSFALDILQNRIAFSFDSSAPNNLYLCDFVAVNSANATPISSLRGCAGTRLPEVGLNPEVAWAFGLTDMTSALLAARGRSDLIEITRSGVVSSSDPPAIEKTTRVEELTAYYAVPTYTIDKDLYPILPGATL